MWSAADVRGTAASVAPWWALLTADLPADVVADLHAPGMEPASLDEVQGALAALSAAGRQVTARGYGMPAQTGRVTGLSLGTDGLPKLPVGTADVTAAGLVGDRQKNRKHHGRVWQALCLWSAEVIHALRAEGHPVFPGACGENMLISDVDWAALRPGTRLRIGSALAEVSMPTVPCKQIRPYFADGAIGRVAHERYPGSSRWYATVVEPGTVAVSDVVAVEPG